MPRQHAFFFPKADAAVLRTRHDPPSPTSRPTETSPIFDAENADKRLDCWSQSVASTLYPPQTDPWAPATIPAEPPHTQSYLFPTLTRNERLRLTMLYYYTQGALQDTELMSRLQEKVHLAQETVGWEFVIAVCSTITLTRVWSHVVFLSLCYHVARARARTQSTNHLV
jgi:hypothetical protein